MEEGIRLLLKPTGVPSSASSLFTVRPGMLAKAGIASIHDLNPVCFDHPLGTTPPWSLPPPSTLNLNKIQVPKRNVYSYVSKPRRR